MMYGDGYSRKSLKRIKLYSIMTFEKGTECLLNVNRGMNQSN